MADKTENKPGFVARAKAAVKNFGARVSKFFRDTKSELKKVVWPSKADVKTNTIVVLITVAIAAVVMILLDAIFGGILGFDTDDERIRDSFQIADERGLAYRFAIGGDDPADTAL